MVIGEVVEPNVTFSVPKVNFGHLLLPNGKASEKVFLQNPENIPCQFNFSRDSIQGDISYGESLTVTPLSGVIGPNATFPVEIAFRPKVEKGFN